MTEFDDRDGVDDFETPRVQALLRERAERLAARPKDTVGEREGPGSEAATKAYLTFFVEDRRYGIEVGHFEEAHAIVRYTRVPGAAAELFGVINVRGAVRTVVELGALMGLPRARSRGFGFALLLRKGVSDAALRVDFVDRVELVADADVLRTNAQRGSVDSPFARGFTLGGLTLLDAERLLSSPFFLA